ncbi:hypothetical protein SAMN05192573_101573 [Mucilaginibacter gossypii]|uniref:Uncharacterized protein n=1 Tax=Mucilaginibacter gossypii TaxID=551996 RepID=A0A1G7PIJ1_9SPHI|nr:hypothetical protein SAMN05192573_101573 [Mucilaginibacter gossypii]
MADNPHRIAKSFKKWFEFRTVRCTTWDSVEISRGLLQKEQPFFIDF